MTQYSFGECAVSSRLAHTTAGIPRRRNAAATVPPPMPTMRGSTPFTARTASASARTTGASTGVGGAAGKVRGVGDFHRHPELPLHLADGLAHHSFDVAECVGGQDAAVEVEAVLAGDGVDVLHVGVALGRLEGRSGHVEHRVQRREGRRQTLVEAHGEVGGGSVGVHACVWYRRVHLSAVDGELDPER